MDHNPHYTNKETQAMRDYYICLWIYYLKGLKSVLNSGFLIADRSSSYFTSKLHRRGTTLVMLAIKCWREVQEHIWIFNIGIIAIT